jgi:GH15 family glucan-1,4-alpha-glucosidase
MASEAGSARHPEAATHPVGLPGTAADAPLPAPEPVADLYDYGLIGNLHTAALVSRFGSVDWACMPRFASASVFGRLLDPLKGGFLSLTPVGGRGSRQRYVPTTNVLETRFSVTGGRRLVLYDFMPVAESGSGDVDCRIVRVLTAVGGAIDVLLTAEPRFQYGRSAARWRIQDDKWLAESGEEKLALVAPFPLSAEGGRADGRFTVAPGEEVAIELHWGEGVPSEVPATELLERTERFWRKWVGGPEAPMHQAVGLWHAWIERSELLLKLLSSARTGAFVAAPTTSLPEWPGGSRNWDYRYVWMRDAAFTAQVFTLLGHLPEARAYLKWILSRILAEGENGHLRVVYSVDGERELDERELVHLSGFRGSKPVRVGNAAVEQFQLDIYGELLDATALLAEFDPVMLRECWPVASWLAERVMSFWRLPDQGIWEIRGPPKHHTHSKLMAWVALDRASRLAEYLGGDPRAPSWRRTADEIRTLIETQGYDPARGAFTQTLESGSPLDATALRIPLTGFLPFDDPRVLSTLTAIERDLGHGPFLYRYKVDDGFDCPEGTFLLCSFWMVECLARSGQREKALAHWQRLLEAASPLGLFAEEFDPVGRRPLGNYPQAFTHIGLLRAALALGFSQHEDDGLDDDTGPVAPFPPRAASGA